MPETLAVLLVEDSESDAQIMVRILKKAGYDPAFERVETAGEMKAALDRQAWDIVISDYNLPQFDGRSALEILKETERDIPFIIVSGAIGEETAVAMMKAGAHDYLMKNNLARLAPAVARELEQAQDRRERKKAEQTLRQISRAVEHSPVSIVITDVNGKIEYVNPKFTELTGYTFEEARGNTTSMLKSGKTPPEIYEDLWQTIQSGGEWKGDLLNRKKNGDLYWEKISISSVTDAKGNITHFVSVNEDITDRREAEEKIRSLNAELEKIAITDYLTSIYNRRYFMERGVQEFKRAKRSKHPLSLLMLDIDKFKNINDTYGHETGDFALKQVVAALKKNLREIDILGRMGGDEFTVMLPNTSLENAAKLAERVRKDMENTVFQTTDESLTISITISAGVSDFTDQTTNIDEMLRNADTALYQAKHSGRNCVIIYRPN
jgi:diguanylate cyclase (GGDEF)-like protein/PAS domain S-box-containing protein